MTRCWSDEILSADALEGSDSAKIQSRRRDDCMIARTRNRCSSVCSRIISNSSVSLYRCVVSTQHRQLGCGRIKRQYIPLLQLPAHSPCVVDDYFVICRIKSSISSDLLHRTIIAMQNS